MNPTIPILGVAVLLVVIIWLANVLVNNDRWWFCPMCRSWHNDTGEVHPGIPTTGLMVSEQKTCPLCARRYNDSL